MKNRPLTSALLLFVTLLVGGYAAGRAHAAQPHMNTALAHLRNARHELDVAAADKGGHRERAIGIVSRAIEQVEAGIEYSRNH